jgi:hypothetical protein
MGLIGGGPTAVGTAVGRQFTSAAMSVMFLTPRGWLLCRHTAARRCAQKRAQGPRALIRKAPTKAGAPSITIPATAATETAMNGVVGRET